MYPGTEELLSIRDSEPVDAEARAAVDADPELQAEVERLQATRDRLRELPELKPPPGVLARVFEELQAESGEPGATPPEPHSPHPATTVGAATDEPGFPEMPAGSRPPAGSRQFQFIGHAQWPLRGAIAATVAVIAVLGVRSLETPVEPAPGDIVVQGPVSTVDSPGVAVSAAYTSLTSESARLERLLNDIPYRPRLVNAGTATMISGLEDRIGQVDEVLMYASANGLPQEQTVVLWQERVDLMNALLQVRYAQAQRFGF